MPKINWQAILHSLNGVVASYYKWFVLGATLLVLWFGWSLLLHAEFTRIRDSGILEYQNRVAQRETRQSDLAQLQQLATQVEGLNQERLDQLHTALPTGLDSVALIDQMQAFATAAHVTILSIDVVKESANTDVGSSASKAAAQTDVTGSALDLAKSNVRTAVITLNVATAKTSYDDFKAFLDTLESFVPVLNLQNLSYTPDSTSYALQLETYYLDSPTQQ